MAETTKQAVVHKPQANTQQLEKKDAKWKRLANKRLPKALKSIQQLANLGNKSQYEYTAEQAKKVLDMLQDAVDAVGRAYQGKQQPTLLDKLFD